MANALSFSVGTTTANIGHAIKATLFVLNQASATAASAVITDVAGNVMVSLACPATIASYPTVPQSPVILPGGTVGSATNWIAIVTGAGAKLFVHYH